MIFAEGPATLVKKAAEKSNTFQQLSPDVLRINQSAYSRFQYKLQLMNKNSIIIEIYFRICK